MRFMGADIFVYSLLNLQYDRSFQIFGRVKISMFSQTFIFVFLDCILVLLFLAFCLKSIN